MKLWNDAKILDCFLDFKSGRLVDSGLVLAHFNVHYVVWDVNGKLDELMPKEGRYFTSYAAAHDCFMAEVATRSERELRAR